MSELKARHIVDVYDSYYAENPFGERSQVYLKSEADKVIAELNAQVDFLKTTHDSCGNCNSCADGMGKVLNEQLDELKKKLIEQTALRMWAETQLHHNKYKRCLAMAGWCGLEQERIELIENQDITDDDFDKLVKGFYKKWRKRWLELAEKFKEEK